MANKYLGRDDAPFGDKIWEALDSLVIGAAKSRLSARKLLDVEGPYGLGLKHVPLADSVVAEGDVRMMASGAIPVPLIETFFTLTPRDLAGFEQTGLSLDTGAVAQAAMAAAEMEDALIYQGNKQLGVPGLLTAEGVQSVKLGNWDDPEAATGNVIEAVSALDAVGFHGPYLLALSPGLHNKLHKLLPHGFRTGLAHVESIVGGKVVKAAGIAKGGVLLATGAQFASIVIGQDMSVGFVGPEDSDLKFKISESVAPRIRVPASICVLKA